jgi:hypothetical protein
MGWGCKRLHPIFFNLKNVVKAAIFIKNEKILVRILKPERE